MKKECSDNRLVLITLIAISISVLSMIVSLTRTNITGASSSEEGYVNVTVLSAVDMTIHTNTINFTAANPGQPRNSYNSSEIQDCETDNYCGMNITNDGTKFINITIQETANLFSGSSYDAAQHFTYNITIQDPLYTTAYGGEGSCSTGYDQGLKGPDDNGQTGQWRAVPRSSAEVAVCYLNYTDAPEGENRPDIARVELNITVPSDEPTGSKTGTLTFTAVEA